MERTETAPGRDDVLETVHEALSRLSPKLQDAVVLRYLNGLSHEEVAEQLGCSISTASMRVARGIEALQRTLAKRGVACSAAMLAGWLSQAAAEELPAGFTDRVLAVCTGQAAVSASTLDILRSVERALFWTKAKVLGIAMLAAALATGGIVTMAAHGAPKSGVEDRPAIRAAAPLEAQAIAAAGAPGGAAPEAAVGTAQVLRLSIREAFPVGGSPTASDLWIHIVRRGEALRAYAFAPRWGIEPAFCGVAGWDAQGKTIKARVATIPNPGGPGALAMPVISADLALTLDGGKVAGTATLQHTGKREWPVEGTARDDGQEAAAADAIDAGKDWPNHNGPGGLCAALPIDRPVVNALADARPLWVSEIPVPYMSAGSSRYARAGTGEVIVYAGNAYVCWSRPSGDAIDEAYLAEAKKGPAPLGYTHEDMARVGADDVLACMDARTGLTKWFAAFPHGISRQTTRHKGFPGCTPGAGDGLVAFVGLAGMFYGVDAKTGRLRWKAPLGSLGDHLQKERERALAARKIAVQVNPDGKGGEFNPRLRVVDGVVLSTVHRSGLIAFSAADGKLLWERPQGVGWRALPQTWKQGDRALVLHRDAGGLVGVDLRTGEVRWKANAKDCDAASVQIAGDRLILSSAMSGAGPKGGDARGLAIACWQIKEDGAHPLWTSKMEGVLQVPHIPVILDGRVYAGGVRQMPLGIVNLSDGKVDLQPYLNGQNSYYSLWGGWGRIFRGSFTILMRSADPAAPIDKANPQAGESKWVLAEGYDDNYPIPAMADGRMFIRALDGVVCYDLRAAREK